MYAIRILTKSWIPFASSSNCNEISQVLLHLHKESSVSSANYNATSQSNVEAGYLRVGLTVTYILVQEKCVRRMNSKPSQMGRSQQPNAQRMMPLFHFYSSIFSQTGILQVLVSR